MPAAPAGKNLTRFAWLSILAAVLTIGLKTEAYLLTGSVGMLSDAAESLVNLVAALAALLLLSFAARPPDPGHPFGHGKAEYFASGFEGALILVAALGILWAAWERLGHPQPLVRFDVGLVFSGIATLINFGVAIVLFRAGRRYRSITLEADARHLLSDVVTTVVIVAALGGIMVTGWLWLDPLIAALAALMIVWSGVALIRRSIEGLLDAAIPDGEKAEIERVLERYRERGANFHALRTRASGAQRYMTIHVLLPGDRSIKEGHDLLEELEADIKRSVGSIEVITHLEPAEDAASFNHSGLEIGSGRSRPHRVEIRRRRGPVARACLNRQARVLLGLSLSILGGAGSLGLDARYVDHALGITGIGLLLALSAWRHRGTRKSGRQL